MIKMPEMTKMMEMTKMTTFFGCQIRAGK